MPDLSEDPLAGTEAALLGHLVAGPAPLSRRPVL
jgi:hypothetical protein